MTKLTSGAALAAFLLGLGALSPVLAQTEQTSAAIETERLLGSGDEDARERALLPFTRSYGASGSVAGSLARSAAAAGVPTSALLEALRALDGANVKVPWDRPAPQDGDAFYVRWQQTFTVEGAPIGVGRVLWLELRPAGGAAATALHRFRPREGAEQFFLTDGQAATPPALALPVDDLNVSSRFGLREDPLAGSPTKRAAGAGMGGPLTNPMTGPPTGPLAGPSSPKQTPAAARRAHWQFSGFAPRRFMHEGVDFAVPQGTPIYAASDGVVAGARPNGGYGNWVRIDHDGGFATAYGHLWRFAPGLKQGARVARGDLIGFSGNTGRSTGPHLHFEVLTDGKPVDPLVHAAVAQLGGSDVERFARHLAAEERERETEAAGTAVGEFAATAPGGAF